MLAANAVCLISERTFFTILMCEKGAFFVNICYYVVSYKCIELEMHMKTKKYESIRLMNLSDFLENISGLKEYTYLKTILEKRLLIILMSGVRMGLSLR